MPDFPEGPSEDASVSCWRHFLCRVLTGASDVPYQEARWILQSVLGWSGTDLLRNAGCPLPLAAGPAAMDILRRRLQGDPLAHCLGRWSFMDLELQVSPDVLIPRPDTETLVRWAIGQMHSGKPWRVLDLGTGSGAVALAIAHAWPDAEIWAVERSVEALRIAEKNGEILGHQVHWCCGDWCAPLPQGLKFDLIVSNPPYLSDSDPHLDELCHEPRMALVSGPEGNECFGTILEQVRPHLQPHTRLALEHGCDQSGFVQGLLQRHGWEDIFTLCDLAGRDRVSGGTWGR